MSAELKPAAELSALEPSGYGLRMRFYRGGDRIRHIVELIVGDRVTPLLESVEGGGEAHWPPSPPFQDLQIHPIANSEPIILLTGATSKCHWSAAVTVRLETFPDDGFPNYRTEQATSVSHRQILFDIACRYKVKPSWLGSSYQPLKEARIGCTPAFAFAGDGQNALTIGPRQGEILPEPYSSPECVVSEYRDTNGISILAVRPPEDTIHSPPSTIRWAYRMILATV